MLSQDIKPVLVIHGGAGTIERSSMTPDKDEAIRKTLNAALEKGYTILEQGGTALDAVEATIVFLEDSPWFNAGKGAVITREGHHELDASIMDGATLNAGAVSGVKTLKNPIKSARLVMEKSPHVMLYGQGAEKFALENGMDTVENSYFTTPSRLERWKALNEGKGENLNPEPSKFGTVGCVALDKNGNIAAGTSTGGMMNKAYNRIGDSPIIGAGTYADNETCGVSCTGHGEYFIRIGVAKEISDQMAFGKKNLEDAVNHTIHERLSGMDASGGLIAIDHKGNVAMPFNTPGMYRGYRKADKTYIGVYGDD
jgi:beta-aspartyl-peptidase (threonine type)